MEIEILKINYGTKEYLDTLDLRNEVFRKPWGLDIKDDNLEEDKDMEMYGLYLENNKLIGTVFLLHKDQETAQIKTLALLENFRGIGLGKYLMDFIENEAKEKGYQKSILMGRVSAKEFYNKLGYKAISKAFDYKTIPHLYMEKKLNN